MSSKPIQGYPPGFLSLLSLKNLGKLPDTLFDNVQATFDLQEWYLRGANQVLRALISGAATGGLQAQAVMGPVPEGELWYVQWFTFSGSAAVAPAAGNWWVELRILDYNGHVRGGKGQSFTQAGASGGSVLVTLEGFWLYPGETLTALWTMGAGDAYEIAQIVGAKLQI